MTQPTSACQPRAIAVSAGHQHEGGAHAQGVTFGPFAFFSAIRGTDPSTGEVPSDPQAQIEQAFTNLGEMLAAMGWGLGDVVRVGMYFTDLQAHRPIANVIWKTCFPEVKPARFAVQVQDLGRPGDASILLLDVVAARHQDS